MLMASKSNINTVQPPLDYLRYIGILRYTMKQNLFCILGIVLLPVTLIKTQLKREARVMAHLHLHMVIGNAILNSQRINSESNLLSGL